MICKTWLVYDINIQLACCMNEWCDCNDPIFTFEEIRGYSGFGNTCNGKIMEIATIALSWSGGALLVFKELRLGARSIACVVFTGIRGGRNLARKPGAWNLKR